MAGARRGAGGGGGGRRGGGGGGAALRGGARGRRRGGGGRAGRVVGWAAGRGAVLPCQCGAGDAVVAVGVVAGVAGQLVPGELGCLLVVGGHVLGWRAGRQRREFQQRRGCLRAVQVAVGDDGALVGAAGPAVVRVQVLHQARAGPAQRDGPRVGVAVGVAGVGEQVAERDPVGGHFLQDGDQGADGIVVAAG